MEDGTSTLPDPPPPKRSGRGRPAGRRSGQQEESREAILNAAVRVVGRDGLPAASLSAIAREAGTSKAAILYHFETRENLLRGLASLALSLLGPIVDQAAVAATEGEDPAHAALDLLFRSHNRAVLAAIREVESLGIRDAGVGAESVEYYDQLAVRVVPIIGDASDDRDVRRARALVIAVKGHVDRWLCSGVEDPTPFLEDAVVAARAIAAAGDTPP